MNNILQTLDKAFNDKITLPRRGPAKLKHIWIHNTYNTETDEGAHGASNLIVRNSTHTHFPVKCVTLRADKSIKKDDYQNWSLYTLKELETYIESGYDGGLQILLHQDMPFAAHFDIEKDYKGTSKCAANQACKQMIKSFSKHIVQLFGQDAWDTAIVEWYGHPASVDGLSLGKLSCHIALTKFHTANKEERYQLKRVIQNFGWDRRNHVDITVYGKNNAFRLLNQTKVGKPWSKMECLNHPGGPCIAREHLYQPGQGSRSIMEIQTIAEITRKHIEDLPPEWAWELTTEDQRLPLPEDFNYRNPNNRPEQIIMALPYGHGEAIMRINESKTAIKYAKASGLSFETFWDSCKKREDTAMRKAKYQTIWSTTTCVKAKINQYHQALGKIFLRYYGKKLFMDTSAHNFLEHLSVEATDTVSDPKDLTFYPRQFPFNNTFRRAILLSGVMGTGKTEWLLELIQHPSKPSVLIILPLNALQSDVHKRITEDSGRKDFVMHTKIKDEWIRANALIITPESLHRIHPDMKYNLIFFDEAKITFDRFMGEANTMVKHIQENVAALFRLCARPLSKDTTDTTSNDQLDYVFFMDGLATKTLIKSLKLLCDSEISIVEPALRKAPRKMLIYKSVDALYIEIVTAIKEGEKVAIFAPGFKQKKRSIAVADVVAYILKETDLHESQMLSYTKADGEKTGNFTERWDDPHIRVIVYNATLAAGVNYSKKNVFNRVFGFYYSATDHHMYHQGLCRIRSPIDPTFHAYIRAGGRRDRQDTKHRTPVEFTDDKSKQFMEIIRQAEDIEQRVLGLSTTFDAYIPKANIEVVLLDSTLKAKAIKRSKEVRKSCRIDQGKIWDEIRLIDKREVEELHNKMIDKTASAEDCFALEKWFHCIQFNDPCGPMARWAWLNCVNIKKLVDISPKRDPESNHTINILLKVCGLQLDVNEGIIGNFRNGMTEHCPHPTEKEDNGQLIVGVWPWSKDETSKRLKQFHENGPSTRAVKTLNGYFGRTILECYEKRRCSFVNKVTGDVEPTTKNLYRLGQSTEVLEAVSPLDKDHPPSLEDTSEEVRAYFMILQSLSAWSNTSSTHNHESPPPPTTKEEERGQKRRRSDYDDIDDVIGPPTEKKQSDDCNR